MEPQKRFDTMLKRALKDGKRKKYEGKQNSWRSSQEKKRDAARRAYQNQRRRKPAL